jgi:hypothetical protein
MIWLIYFKEKFIENCRRYIPALSRSEVPDSMSDFAFSNRKNSRSPVPFCSKTCKGLDTNKKLLIKPLDPCLPHNRQGRTGVPNNAENHHPNISLDTE